MTFNVRYAASDRSPNSWPERRPVLRQLLQQERPDIIGAQEGLYQLRDIESDLPTHYDSIGEGLDGGSRGEAMQVFYDSRRFQPLEYDHYWLSDTPDVVGSKTWGGCCPRMMTWVRLLDERTGEQLHVLNTHPQAFDASARSKSADLILQRMSEDFDPALPVLATGDFNEPAAPGQDGPRQARHGRSAHFDTCATTQERSDLLATFYGYRPLTPNGDRIAGSSPRRGPDAIRRHQHLRQEGAVPQRPPAGAGGGHPSRRRLTPALTRPLPACGDPVAAGRDHRRQPAGTELIRGRQTDALRSHASTVDPARRPPHSCSPP